jgi:AcrR family transcriptional regulator
MPDAVKPSARPRTRRARKAAQTRQRILDAATGLFLERGYAATTIDAIAERADVAVETVYSRFGNKATVVEAILEPAIVGSDDGRDIFDRPEIARIRSITDHREQIHRLAAFSRGILERTHVGHRILTSAAAADANAAELQRRDTIRRVTGQRRYIDMLMANGPLHLSAEDAAVTYSALANPNTYTLLTRDCGWSADRFQHWLEKTLVRVLLD